MFRLPVVLLSLAALVSSVQGAEMLPAFPGAEGAGAMTPGGRGGRVIYVTTLEDNARGNPVPGSLREAIEAEGPRIVLFQVGGIIELQRGLIVRNPYLTVAGQSAPGGGICLKNRAIAIKGTHDVVLRYLRVRPGDVSEAELDGLSVYESQRVMIDHCSVSWSVDEALSVTGNGCTDVTVQWCLIAEGLNRSVHAKGEHGYGSLIRTNGIITYHHNLYAHFKTRCPRPGTYGEGVGLLDFRNNVIYDWIDPPGYSASDPTRMNYVGNYLRAGPSTTDQRTAFDVGGAETTLYVEDNVIEGKKVQDPWELIRKSEIAQRLDRPLPAPPVTTHAAAKALELVLDEAGATKPTRDAVDVRLIGEVESRQGKVINSQKDVGGWPEYAGGTPRLDSDGDGIPDDWEREHKLDPENPGDAARDTDKNGYLQLEDYLNELAE